jgi:hypothetical protein
LNRELVNCLLIANERPIDIQDIRVAVKNMRLYESGVGNAPIIPIKVVLCVCIYIPAMAGPTDAPIIRISVLIPSETPISFLGVVNMITFIAPTFVNESPVDRIARSAETRNSVE